MLNIDHFIEFANANNVELKIVDDDDLCIDDNKSHVACYLFMLHNQIKYNFNIVLRMNDDEKKIIYAVNDEFYDKYKYNIDFKIDGRENLYFSVKNGIFVCDGVADDDDE